MGDLCRRLKVARLIVKYLHGGKLEYVNIEADQMEEKEGFLFAWKGKNIVGAFDLGLIGLAYLSEEGSK